MESSSSEANPLSPRSPGHLHAPLHCHEVHATTVTCTVNPNPTPARRYNNLEAATLSASFPGGANKAFNSYLNDATRGVYGLPAGGAMGVSKSGQDIFPVPLNPNPNRTATALLTPTPSL